MEKEDILPMSDEAKITGIGGIFFKCEDPETLKKWYSTHFRFETDQYGHMFQFRPLNDPDKVGHLQWSTFPKDSKYMEPSKKEFMINYRVSNIEQLVENLKAAGVQVLDEIESYDYGKFVHVLDPEGNKIELWEPVDLVFEEYLKKPR